MEGVARLFLAIAITYCLVGLLLSILPDKAPSGTELPDLLQLLIGGLFPQAAVLGWIALFLRQHAIGWGEAFGFAASSPAKAAAYGLAVGLCFLPIGWGLQALSGDALELAGFKPQEQVAVQALQDPNLSSAEKIALGVLAVVLAPMAEESFFRGILYPSLKQRGHRRLAWWGTSALFALMHFNEATFVPLMAFAMVLIFIYEAFGNLLAPMVAHCVFNLANVIVVIYQDQLARLLHLT